MDRRIFLKSMSALAVAAMAAPLAVAAVVEAPKPNKYKEAIRLFDRIVAGGDEVNQRYDDLLVFLKDNFPAPEINAENIEATRLVLQSKVDIAGIRGIPPNIADEVYPIALSRLGLREYKLPLKPSKIKHFDWFHETYGELIIKGHS